MRRFLALLLLGLMPTQAVSSVGIYSPQAAIEGEQWETWELMTYLTMSGFEIEIQETNRIGHVKDNTVLVSRHPGTKGATQSFTKFGFRKTHFVWGRFLFEGKEEDIARLKHYF